jgi:hypothetical protein
MSTDYESRAKTYGFATKEQVLEALKDPSTIVLDVRSQPEIDAQGIIPNIKNKHVQSDCTPSTCPILESTPEKILPDKQGM